MWYLWLLLAIALVAVLAFAFCTLALYMALKEVRHHDDAAYARSLKGEMAQYAKVILDAQEATRHISTEVVETRSFDGLRLVGEIYPAEGKARGWILLAHGFHGSGRGDFSCVLEMYHNFGMDILLIDQRSQGRSEGKRIGLGVLERHDVVSWANFMAQRKPEQGIILSGISMGAASVMMASDLELPAQVKGIVADCGFTTPDEIVYSVLRSLHLPGCLMPIVRLIAKPLLGYRLTDASAPDSLSRSKLPIRIIHGVEDRFVPCWMSDRCFEAAAAEDKKLIQVPKATHGMSYMVDPVRCIHEIESFISTLLD